MTRPKNTVSLSPNNKERTVWRLRKGKAVITKSSTTIWKALEHLERMKGYCKDCPFKEEIG